MAAIRAERPDHVLVAGDLVLNGPDPAAVDRRAARDGVRRRRRSCGGNTDIAVADFDYGAAFPQYQDGVPETREPGRASGPTTS